MQLPESHYRDNLALLEGGRTEVPVLSGYIDVLTPTDLIEVKFYRGWKEAIGQVLAYGHYYPNHQKRIHLILPNEYTDLSMVLEVCKPLNILVTSTVEGVRKSYRYFIGLMSFDTSDEVERYVKEILDRHTISPDEEKFMVSLLNLAPWVTSKYKGPITAVRVVKHYRGCYYFQARSEHSTWLSLSYRNYHKYIHRAKEEVEDFTLPEPWDYPSSYSSKWLSR